MLIEPSAQASEHPLQPPALTSPYPVEVLEDIALISVAAELLRLDDYERRSISKFYKGMRQL